MKCLRIIWIYFLLFLVIFPVVAEKESAEETIVLQVVGEAFMIHGHLLRPVSRGGGTVYNKRWSRRWEFLFIAKPRSKL